MHFLQNFHSMIESKAIKIKIIEIKIKFSLLNNNNNNNKDNNNYSTTFIYSPITFILLPNFENCIQKLVD